MTYFRRFGNLVTKITLTRINSIVLLPSLLIILVLTLPNSAVGGAVVPPARNVTLDTGPRLTGHTSWINSLRFSPDGKTLATGDLGGAIRLWNVETGEELHSINESLENVTFFRFSPGGSVLAAGRNDGVIELRSPTTGRIIRRLRKDLTTIFALAFSPGGKYLASGHRSGDVHLWEVETGNYLKQLEAHPRNVSGLAFSPRGNRLVTAGYEGSLKFWNPTTGEKLADLSTDTSPINVVAFSPEGRYLVWGTWTGELVARDMGADSLKNHSFTESAGDVVETIKFYPGGDRMASGSRNGTVKIWNPKTGRRLEGIKSNDWAVYTMRPGSDGILMGGIDQTTGGYDGIIIRWSVRCGSSDR